MKKQITVLCAALLCLLAAFAPGAAAAPALTTTEAYCIIDADTGLVLAQQNMDEELHPASITKVMTLGLACEKAQGQWDGVKLAVSHDYGIYHCTGNGICSWYDFACAIMQGAGLSCKVEPVTSAEYAAAAIATPADGPGQPPGVERPGEPYAALHRRRRDARLAGRPQGLFCKLEWRTLIYENLSCDRLRRFHRLELCPLHAGKV